MVAYDYSATIDLIVIFDHTFSIDYQIILNNDKRTQKTF